MPVDLALRYRKCPTKEEINVALDSYLDNNQHKNSKDQEKSGGRASQNVTQLHLSQPALTWQRLEHFASQLPAVLSRMANH